MEIVPGIHSIPTELDTRMGSFAPRIYLVASATGAFVDSGYGNDELANSIVEYSDCHANVKPAYIIITHAHPDHISGATRLMGKTGAKLVLHAAERTDLHVDLTVNDGDTISLGGIDLEVVHTPGHNPGHICLYYRKGRVMFTGDHVLAEGTTALQPPWGNMTNYIASLHRLLDYDIDLMLPAHGPPVTDPRRRLEHLIRHRLRREDQIVSILSCHRCTIEELASQIYADLSGFFYAVAKGQIEAHLEKLEEEGRVVSQEEGANRQYSINSCNVH